MKQIGSDEARSGFRDLLNEVEHQGEHVTILRYQTPAAVVVPVGWYRTADGFMDAADYERKRVIDLTALVGEILDEFDEDGEDAGALVRAERLAQWRERAGLGVPDGPA